MKIVMDIELADANTLSGRNMHHFTQENISKEAIDEFERTYELAALQLLKRKQDEDPTAEFIRWYVLDEHGYVVRYETELVEVVPARR